MFSLSTCTYIVSTNTVYCVIHTYRESDTVKTIGSKTSAALQRTGTALKNTGTAIKESERVQSIGEKIRTTSVKIKVCHYL